MAQLSYTFWLVPAEPIASHLDDIIRKLALRFDAQSFEPHVTIYAGPSNRGEASSIVSDIAANFVSLNLELEQIDESSIYSKTLFLQFRRSEALRAIFDFVRNNLGNRAEYVLNPHLSLLYQKLSAEQRRELCRRLEVPGGSYYFDGIRAVEFEPPWSERSMRRTHIVAESKLQNLGA
jgi:2'-5' RNA ligase